MKRAKIDFRNIPMTLLLTLTLAASPAIAQEEEENQEPATAEAQAETTEPTGETDAAAEDAQGEAAEPRVDLRSYALGVQLGQNVNNVYGNVEVDYEVLLKGLKDELAGERSVELADYEIAEYVEETRAELRGDMQALENLRESRKFLRENAQREDVTVLENGLQYIVINEGEGETPEPTDRVKVHYRGTLTDGTEFDSSLDGDPATFPVRGVIQGWQEALVLMKEGAKWELFIPPYLAYGQQGSGRAIGPNEALIFEVELLEIMD